FDVVYLNSVFHWIADKPRALAQMMRVLKPGGRLGFNCQDATRPNESRVSVERALAQCGVDADYGVVHPSLALSSAALAALLTAAGFDTPAIETRTLVDFFPDADAVIAWSSSSSFGNFLVGISAADRAAMRKALPRVLAPKVTGKGIRLERYLLFATAWKP